MYYVCGDIVVFRNANCLPCVASNCLSTDPANSKGMHYWPLYGGSAPNQSGGKLKLTCSIKMIFLTNDLVKIFIFDGLMIIEL